ncbi:MAG: outer membrane beta-barrel protein [Alphaproteobacteria bacterium]|nr:outer membrane beta-barrel protein [Alphaproteobacteria bacterium]
MSGTRPLRYALLLAPVATAGAGAVQAQEADPFALRPPSPLLRDDVAGTRTFPGMAPAGRRAGPLRVFPAVSLRAGADSNVLGRTADRRGDAAITLAPALAATGTSGKAEYGLTAAAALTRYASLTDQNSETWDLGARITTPLAGRLTLAAGGGWSRRLEPNDTAAAAAVDGSATLYRQLGGDLALRAALGPLRITGSLALARSTYLPVTRADGTAIDQSFRDQRTVTAGFRLEHALPGGRVIFAQANLRRADSLDPLACCDRSSNGGEALGGITTSLGSLFNAEVAVGIRWRTYDAPAFRSYSGLAWRARLEWYPTPLVSVALTGQRDIVDSGIPTAAGTVVDRAEVKMFYEFRRNLDFVLTASATREKVRDRAPVSPPAPIGPPAPGFAPNPGAHSESVGAEARYALSNRYLVGAFTRFRNRSADNALLPRQGRAVEAGLSLRLSL